MLIVPIKWLAPETMQNRIYSIKSDVWSYGIMVWEIYSEGCEPYPSLSNVQTRAKIIVQDYRMDMPQVFCIHNDLQPCASILDYY
ncbi:unnamed protein product [Thelazia callipaeda]|uniref:Protein kinase domain-containing protein n=1 Tax=Thelazia callipaeda TaxID=103827 RepID=A0A0N5CSI9_THECL|nr:unnamed protein product [Thelazia callipaeda]